MLKKEHDNYVFSLIKAVTHTHCNVRRRGTTWWNTIRTTGKFFRKTITKLKLFNCQSHPVLHAWIARTLYWGNIFVSCLVWGVWYSVSVTLQSAQCFTFDVPILYIWDQYSSTFFFPSQAQDVFRVTGEETGKLLLEICCNALRTDTD